MYLYIYFFKDCSLRILTAAHDYGVRKKINENPVKPSWRPVQGTRVLIENQLYRSSNEARQR